MSMRQHPVTSTAVCILLVSLAISTYFGLTAIIGVLLVGLVIGLYMLPTIIASARSHPQTPAIAVLNILAGWTFLGWVGAMVWAFITQTPTLRTLQ